MLDCADDLAHAGLRGASGGVSLALAAYAAVTAVAISDRFVERPTADQVAVIPVWGWRGSAWSRSSRVMRRGWPSVLQCGWP